MVLWSKSQTLDREIRGSNLGGEAKIFHTFESKRGKKLRKMMSRISSHLESVRDRKAEGISRKNGRAEGTSPVGGT